MKDILRRAFPYIGIPYHGCNLLCARGTVDAGTRIITSIQRSALPRAHDNVRSFAHLRDTHTPLLNSLMRRRSPIHSCLQTCLCPTDGSKSRSRSLTQFTLKIVKAWHHVTARGHWGPLQCEVFFFFTLKNLKKYPKNPWCYKIVENNVFFH